MDCGQRENGRTGHKTQLRIAQKSFNRKRTDYFEAGVKDRYVPVPCGANMRGAAGESAAFWVP